MEKFAAVLFAFLAIIYLVFIVIGMVSIWPFGIIGMVVLVGFVIIFGWIVKDRLNNKEDDYYSKNVDK